MSIGDALLEESRRVGDARLACRSAEAFATAAAMSTLPAMQEVARKQRVAAARLCRPEYPEPSNVGGWLLAGGAVASGIGGTLLLLASDEQRSVRDQATRDAEAARDQTAYDEARRTAVQAHEHHLGLGIGGYALLAVGVGLGVTSYFAWRPSDEARITVVVQPGGLGLMGRF